MTWYSVTVRNERPRSIVVVDIQVEAADPVEAKVAALSNAFTEWEWRSATALDARVLADEEVRT